MLRWIRIVVGVYLMCAAPAGANQLTDTLQGFFATTKAILTGGKDLFRLLATDQVLRVTSDLSSQAGDIDAKKEALRKEINEGRNINSNTVDLIGQVSGFGFTLDKFATEIDRIGNQNKIDLHVDELRQESTKLTQSKLRELEDLLEESNKPSPNRDALEAKLDAAIADSKKLKVVTRCLHRTLVTQELACKPDSF